MCRFRVQDFWRVCSSVLVDESGFGRVQSLVFLNLDLGLAHFWQNRFHFWAFWRGLNGFEVRFLQTNLDLSEFKFQPVKLNVVRSSLYLGSIQRYFPQMFFTICQTFRASF